MVHLHKSTFQSHGYLSSANCHVDSRWVLKISGFALHAFRNEDCIEQVINAFYSILLLPVSYLHFTLTVTVINSASVRTTCIQSVFTLLNIFLFTEAQHNTIRVNKCQWQNHDFYLKVMCS